MSMSKDSVKGVSVTPKDATLEKEFYSNNFEVEFTSLPSTNKTLKDLSVIGSFYVNSIQMEDYLANPQSILTQKFSLVPLYSELTEIDDSFNAFKGITGLMSKFSSPALAFSAEGLASRSYISVFNNFRSDFEDFA